MEVHAVSQIIHVLLTVYFKMEAGVFDVSFFEMLFCDIRCRAAA